MGVAGCGCDRCCLLLWSCTCQCWVTVLRRPLFHCRDQLPSSKDAQAKATFHADTGRQFRCALCTGKVVFVTDYPMQLLEHQQDMHAEESHKGEDNAIQDDESDFARALQRVPAAPPERSVEWSDVEAVTKVSFTLFAFSVCRLQPVPSTSPAVKTAAVPVMMPPNRPLQLPFLPAVTVTAPAPATTILRASPPKPPTPSLPGEPLTAARAQLPAKVQGKFWCERCPYNTRHPHAFKGHVEWHKTNNPFVFCVLCRGEDAFFDDAKFIRHGREVHR